VGYDSDGTAQTGTLDLPSVDDVRLNVTFDGVTKTGTVTIPAEGDVRAGILYDANESRTGTLDVSGSVPIFPAVSDVRLGITYGTDDNPTQFTGNVRAAPPENVLEGYAYDANDAVVGSLSCGTGGENIIEQNIRLVRGDDFVATWEFSDDWPDLAGATFKYGHGYGQFEKPATSGTDGISVTLTSDETAAMRGIYRYDLQATLSDGSIVTLAGGQTQVAETETDVPTNEPIDVGWIG
jgi:hypothetical protein